MLCCVLRFLYIFIAFWVDRNKHPASLLQVFQAGACGDCNHSASGMHNILCSAVLVQWRSFLGYTDAAERRTSTDNHRTVKWKRKTNPARPVQK